MAHNNSDGVKGCMHQLDNSGNTADPSSGGEPKNHHSQIDSAGATGQPLSNQNGREGGRENTPKFDENAEKMTKKAKTDEVQNPNPTHSKSGEGSSNWPSQSAPVDTSDVSSDASTLGKNPKPVIELGPTYPIQNLKTLVNFSEELNQPPAKKEHTILIDVRVIRNFSL